MKKKNWKQLKNQWQKINNSCHKFSACYKQVCQRKKSDSFEIDVMRDAHAIYLQDLKTSFKLQNVWEIVRNHPKWLAQFD